jgi:hypothetical protein
LWYDAPRTIEPSPGDQPVRLISTEVNAMPNVKGPPPEPAASDAPRPTAAQIAAMVEAAYILDAVRR